MKDTRPQSLFDLATRTREKVRALDDSDLPEDKLEEAQFMAICQAVVVAFDILTEDKPKESEF